LLRFSAGLVVLAFVAELVVNFALPVLTPAGSSDAFVAFIDAALQGAILVAAGFPLARRFAARATAAEVAASSENERLQTLLETASDGIHVLDARGDIVFFSHSFARMLGYTREQAARLNALAWLTPDQLAALRARDAAAPGQPRTIETHFRRSDGQFLDVEVSARDLRLQGIEHLYCSARDVSERKRHEREVQSHMLELEHTNKELDEFVYVASHDLRSPLRAVSSLAGWIHEDDRNLDSKTSERLRLIQSRAQRMTRLLDDILKYARVRKGTRQAGPRLSAAALVADIAATIHIPDGFRVELDPSLQEAMVLRMPLEQLLHNLIANGINHHDRKQGLVTVAVAPSGDGYRFTVTDDGPGIPEAYRQTIFDMFTVLKPRDEVEGSGMGLAILRKIVLQLGGRCGVEPAPGRGSCFWFEWPMPDEQPQDQQQR
jgi:PAS domain S-box-containing protein